MLKDKVERLLKMSIYDPEFERSFSKTIDELLEEKATKSTMTFDEAQNAINALLAKKSGILMTDVREAFIVFKRDYIGMRNVKFLFERVGLSSFLEARQLCADFYKDMLQSLNEGKHKKYNNFLYNFVLNKAKELVQNLDSETANKWDLVECLKITLLNAAKSELIDRNKYANFSKLIISVMLDDLKKSKETNGISKMKAFGEDEELLPDLDEVTITLQYNFLVDYLNFYPNYMKYKDSLLKLLTENKITGELYDSYSARLNGIVNSLIQTNSEEFEPILTYQYLRANNKDMERMLAFNEESIFNACKFAESFTRNLSNDDIKNLVITYTTDTAYVNSKSNLADSSRANMNLIVDSLSLLRRYDIITATEYFDYKKELAGETK